MIDQIEKETSRKMDHTIDVFKQDLNGVRTGRASGGLLTNIMVEYYGTPTPLNQIAQIGVPDSQLITVTPFDKSIIKEIEKAIMQSDLGLNPSSDGGLIRVPVPALTEERRIELSKHVKRMGEDSKVALRNIRREANEKLKKMEKEKEISQDQERDVPRTHRRGRGDGFPCRPRGQR